MEGMEEEGQEEFDVCVEMVLKVLHTQHPEFTGTLVSTTCVSTVDDTQGRSKTPHTQQTYRSTRSICNKELNNIYM